ncbi:hypothetical protein SAMN02799624_05399 [Paenibacillus sp. UNC496MF]|uniref:hypothetical protein n=1 Tax=Paenibacillus sp. UNC496MF TaxID=1502753 RepID=UPI0008F29CFB|nr:hypothetical protein [Paenibacillus sp. UNC496MF]SFJ65455.1 hypothetical protein SAMN02799624_05399 [Paenibacillus sp. UNC496MF]
MAKKSNSFGDMGDFTKIMFSQAQRQLDDPCWCRYCGADIKQPGQNSTKDNMSNRWHNDWEIENNAHMKCHGARGRR